MIVSLFVCALFDCLVVSVFVLVACVFVCTFVLSVRLCVLAAFAYSVGSWFVCLRV